MNRNDGAVGDARKRVAESIARPEERDDHHIATGQDLPARQSYLDLADLIADDTDEPMWSAVVIAKHVIDSEWMARVIADAKAEALREAADAVPDRVFIITNHDEIAGWLRDRAEATR